MSTTKLSRTAGTPTSSKKFTISYWVKRSNNGSAGNGHIFDTYVDSTNRSQIHFNDDNVIDFRLQVSGSNTGRLKTNRVFRDTSAWYHIVASVDTTLGTADDRVKLYINGVQETSFSSRTNPSQNSDFPMAGTHTLGAYGGGTNYFDGTLTHVHFTDGYTYQASTFGESDSTSGIWKPKTAPSVTYGTNGFFLKFENSGAMGTDSSGNSNTFTVSGTLTQILDTPSNNFATLNPAPSVEIGSGAHYEYGGTNVRSSTSNWVAGVSGVYLNQGKWYFEMQPGSTTDAEFGIAGENKIQNGGTSGGVNGRLFYYEDTTGYAYAYSASNGQIYFSTPSDGTQTTSYGNSFGTSDIAGCFADLDNNKLYFSKNGTIQNSGTGYTIQGDIYYAFGANSYNANTSLNFGNGTFKGVKLTGTTYADANGEGIFKYSPNQGGAANFDSSAKNFYAICTKNLKEFG